MSPPVAQAVMLAAPASAPAFCLENSANLRYETNPSFLRKADGGQRIAEICFLANEPVSGAGAAL